jgi:hypothetical protein
MRLPDVPADFDAIQAQLPEGWKLLGPRVKGEHVIWEAQGPLGVASAASPRELVELLSTALDKNPTLRPSRSGKPERGLPQGLKVNRRRRGRRRKIEDGLFRCAEPACRALVYVEDFADHARQFHGREPAPEHYEDVNSVPDVVRWRGAL